jgi:hypothetical protein
MNLKVILYLPIQLAINLFLLLHIQLLVELIKQRKNMELSDFHHLMKDERGIMRTTSLFWESRRDTSDDPKFAPIFTLKPQDWEKDGVLYISIKAIYFTYDHIPGYEYNFAMDVFGSWDHWVKLTKSSLRNEFQAWRDEMDMKLKAEAIQHMIKASRSNDAKGVAAAKYLADKGYLQNKKGRPSKDDITWERKQLAREASDIMGDAERLGIKIVKG